VTGAHEVLVEDLVDTLSPLRRAVLYAEPRGTLYVPWVWPPAGLTEPPRRVDFSAGSPVRLLLEEARALGIEIDLDVG
jgi:hypothetical protein